MAATMKTLGIDRMSVDDRMRLLGEIWDSIAAEAGPPPLSEAQRRELERRLADHAASPDDVIPWERIKAEAQARFAK
jgi:putative addiction module component (TIGR02574 family)